MPTTFVWGGGGVGAGGGGGGPLPFFGLKCCLFGSSSRCFLSRQDLVHHRRPFALFAFRGYIQPQP